MISRYPTCQKCGHKIIVTQHSSGVFRCSCFCGDWQNPPHEGAIKGIEQRLADYRVSWLSACNSLREKTATEQTPEEERVRAREELAELEAAHEREQEQCAQLTAAAIIERDAHYATQALSWLQEHTEAREEQPIKIPSVSLTKA